jgi:hypothetical protein
MDKRCEHLREPLINPANTRDLYLSQWHAVYLEGLLVTIGSLVNGSTIVRCNGDERLSLEYFHLELAGPDIIFAEGTPSATLVVESGDYSQFDNGRERLTLDETTGNGPGEYRPSVKHHRRSAPIAFSSAKRLGTSRGSSHGFRQTARQDRGTSRTDQGCSIVSARRFAPDGSGAPRYYRYQ